MEFPKLSFPKTIRIFADPETFYIEACLNQIPKGANNAIALDAGAGPQGKKIFLTKRFGVNNSLRKDSICLPVVEKKVIA